MSRTTDSRHALQQLHVAVRVKVQTRVANTPTRLAARMRDDKRSDNSQRGRSRSRSPLPSSAARSDAIESRDQRERDHNSVERNTDYRRRDDQSRARPPWVSSLSTRKNRQSPRFSAPSRESERRGTDERGKHTHTSRRANETRNYDKQSDNRDNRRRERSRSRSPLTSSRNRPTSPPRRDAAARSDATERRDRRE